MLTDNQLIELAKFDRWNSDWNKAFEIYNENHQNKLSTWDFSSYGNVLSYMLELRLKQNEDYVLFNGEITTILSVTKTQ